MSDPLDKMRPMQTYAVILDVDTTPSPPPAPEDVLEAVQDWHGAVAQLGTVTSVIVDVRAGSAEDACSEAVMRLTAVLVDLMPEAESLSVEAIEVAAVPRS